MPISQRNTEQLKTGNQTCNRKTDFRAGHIMCSQVDDRSRLHAV